MLAAVAEFESCMVLDRIRVALAAAKRRGTKLGGFRGRIATDADRQRAAAAKTALANSRARDVGDTLKSLQAEGITSYGGIAIRALDLAFDELPSEADANEWDDAS